MAWRTEKDAGWQDVRVPLLLGRQRLAALGRHQHPTLSSQDRVTLRSNGHDDRVCNPRMSHWLLLAPSVHIRYLSLTLHPDTEPDMSSCSPCSPRTSNERSGLLWGGETEGYMETPQQLENACRVLPLSEFYVSGPSPCPAPIPTGLPSEYLDCLWKFPFYHLLRAERSISASSPTPTFAHPNPSGCSAKQKVP